MIWDDQPPVSRHDGFDRTDMVSWFCSIHALVRELFRTPMRSQRVPLVLIDAPRLGILNLKVDEASSIVAEDTKALAAVLGPAAQSSDTAPSCDVLFLYCDISTDGRVGRSGTGLRDLIRDSGAAIVVVASENEPEAYVAAAKNKSYGRANLVMTIHRRGSAFPTFFTRLFSEMKAGTSMPVAWVKLVPQIPGREHEHVNLPATIFSCERGQIAFA